MTMRQVPAGKGVMTITQNEFAVSADPECILSSILGSCVATCLWDPVNAVGGMNHILVARSDAGASRCDAAGVNAMELLINALVRMGAQRANLNAKVFGGAKMITGLSDIGQLNAIFVLEFLEREGIPCIGKSLGGSSARQVRFFPTHGRALRKSVTGDAPVAVPVKSDPEINGNDVELF